MGLPHTIKFLATSHREFRSWFVGYDKAWDQAHGLHQWLPGAIRRWKNTPKHTSPSGKKPSLAPSSSFCTPIPCITVSAFLVEPAPGSSSFPASLATTNTSVRSEEHTSELQSRQ